MEEYCLPSFDQKHKLFPIHQSSSFATQPPSFSPISTSQNFTTDLRHDSSGISGSKQEVPNPYFNQKRAELVSNIGSATETKEAKPGKSTKAKNPRYAFQTRSQVDILDDGYRWRKYGLKAVKNNKFPRSYYRCTHQSCNVKKQVQRLSNDESIVVTTYEGIHTHPIEKPTDNFNTILSQMQMFNNF